MSDVYAPPMTDLRGPKSRFVYSSLQLAVWTAFGYQTFQAPLKKSLVALTGQVATYTRSTTATWTDQDGVTRTAAVNQARMNGMRCVTNLYANSTTLVTQGVTTVAGQYIVSFWGTGTVVLSGTATGTLVGTGVGNRVSMLVTTTAGTLTSTVTGSCTQGQLENVTGQSTQTVGDYVSTGVLSSPWYGAGIDGVAYFDTTLTGAKVSDPSPYNGLPTGYLNEPAATNLLLNSATPATQNVTTTAQPYTVSFWGTGTCVLAGTATGTLNGTGATARAQLTVTATAGTLICTFSGSTSQGQVEAAASATSWISTVGAAVTRTADSLTYLYSPAILYNTLLQSQTLATTWSISSSAVATNNATTDVNGGSTASTLACTATAGSGVYSYANPNVGASVAITQCAVLKTISGSSTAFRLGADYATCYITINPQTGAITANAATISQSSSSALANGYTLYAWSFTTPATTPPMVLTNQGAATVTMGCSGTGQFTGTYTALQIQQMGGIPLTTTVADSNSVGTFSVTLAAQGAVGGTSYPGVALQSAASTNVVGWYAQPNLSSIGSVTRTGSTAEMALTPVSSPVAKQAYKIAMSWKSGRLASSTNSAAVISASGSGSGYSAPAAITTVNCSALDNNWNGIVTNVSIYSQPLPDATLQAITT